MVLRDSAVAQAPVSFHEPRDGAFDHGPVMAVIGLEVRVLGAGAVFAQEFVLGMQLDLPAPGGGGAAGLQRAAAAPRAEGCPALRGARADQPVRARQRTGGRVENEIINGESAGDRDGQGPGLDERLGPGPGQRLQQFPGPVGRVRQDLDRPQSRAVSAPSSSLPASASVLPSPAALVIAPAVTSPVSGSATIWALNPSRRSWRVLCA